MRELLSLRRDEAPVIGEVYRYKNEFLKCVADNGSVAEGCEKCCFDVRSCYGACVGEFFASPSRHFELVPENELETAADVKFRHVEETEIDAPFIGERLIADVGLVEYVKMSHDCPSVCRLCDLTQLECHAAYCGPECYYKRVT